MRYPQCGLPEKTLQNTRPITIEIVPARASGRDLAFSLDSRCGTPVEGGVFTGSACDPDLGRCQQSRGGSQADLTGRTCSTGGTIREVPGHEDRAAATVRFHPGIFAGVSSRRLVEVRASALVRYAKNAHAPLQPTSRQSRLAGRRVPVKVLASASWWVAIDSMPPVVLTNSQAVQSSGQQGPGAVMSTEAETEALVAVGYAVRVAGLRTLA